ncbi:hypothetical protein TNCV_435941 [Trichonephila clavipes]|nr:hypothetical protein TNCV_435941 [Trichonephila clavipes]
MPKRLQCFAAERRRRTFMQELCKFQWIKNDQTFDKNDIRNKLEKLESQLIRNFDKADAAYLSGRSSEMEEFRKQKY